MAKPRAPKASRFTSKTSTKVPQGLPDRETLLKFIRETGEAEKTDIAKAFGLKGAERKALREMLRSLEADGSLGRRGRKGFAESGAVPPVGVVDVTERDADGELMVRLTRAEDAPLVRLAPDRSAPVGGAPGLGDRLLVRFERLENGELEARLIKRLGASAHKVLGVIRKARRETRVEPVDRKSKESLLIPEAEARDLRDGDLVLASVGASEQRYGPKRGKILEVVGREDQPRAASLIAIHSHGIPTGFSPEGEAEAEAARSAKAS
ncbi:ribonuclease R [mine drainage metagenome]|uniref:Ribonuclease R n=1 Tax=mine drainage metagenome TaxID=410659 RepID=A0A1J5PGG3_9ZZZZ